MILCRHLRESDFEQLHQTTLRAFSNYVVEYQPTQEVLRRMLFIENVQLDLSVGAFDGEKMVGFTINGAGRWNEKATAYDAGTGVLPEYQRRGISRQMFDFILPVLRAEKFEQYLLEVIKENEPAFRLYRDLGFETQRELGVFRQKEFLPVKSRQGGVEVKELKTLDWELLKSFWSYYPSWQNSIDAIKRGLSQDSIVKTILGLFFQGKLIGYGIVFHRSGSVPQIAVSEEYRGYGFGHILINALREKSGKPLSVLNVDTEAEEVMTFLMENNFELLTSQYEMLLKL